MIWKPLCGFPSSVTSLPAGHVLSCKRLTASRSSRPLNLCLRMSMLGEKSYMMMSKSRSLRSSLGFANEDNKDYISYLPIGLMVLCSSRRAIFVSFAFFPVCVLSFPALGCVASDVLALVRNPWVTCIGADTDFFDNVNGRTKSIWLDQVNCYLTYDFWEDCHHPY